MTRKTESVHEITAISQYIKNHFKTLRLLFLYVDFSMNYKIKNTFASLQLVHNRSLFADGQSRNAESRKIKVGHFVTGM